MAKYSGRQRLKILAIVLLCLFTAYVVSYVVLSRRGYAVSKAIGAHGFYFFAPENTDTWRWMNYGCVYFYLPLILIDNWIGTGESYAAEPMWRLSSYSLPPFNLFEPNPQSLIPNPFHVLLPS